MTTYDPDTSEQHPNVLRDIVRRFGGRLCLNAAVTRAGKIEEGDAVELITFRTGDSTADAIPDA